MRAIKQEQEQEQELLEEMQVLSLGSIEADPAATTTRINKGDEEEEEEEERDLGRSWTEQEPAAACEGLEVGLSCVKQELKEGEEENLGAVEGNDVVKEEDGKGDKDEGKYDEEDDEEDDEGEEEQDDEDQDEDGDVDGEDDSEESDEDESEEEQDQDPIKAQEREAFLFKKRDEISTRGLALARDMQWAEIHYERLEEELDALQKELYRAIHANNRTMWKPEIEDEEERDKERELLAERQIKKFRQYERWGKYMAKLKDMVSVLSLDTTPGLMLMRKRCAGLLTGWLTR
jgi:hypothetical protein